MNCISGVPSGTIMVYILSSYTTMSLFTSYLVANLMCLFPPTMLLPSDSSMIVRAIIRIISITIKVKSFSEHRSVAVLLELQS